MKRFTPTATAVITGIILGTTTAITSYAVNKDAQNVQTNYEETAEPELTGSTTMNSYIGEGTAEPETESVQPDKKTLSEQENIVLEGSDNQTKSGNEGTFNSSSVLKGLDAIEKVLPNDETLYGEKANEENSEVVDKTFGISEQIVEAAEKLGNGRALDFIGKFIVRFKESILGW